jgi:formylglycine-generating enzyme required for sulfatase activity
VWGLGALVHFTLTGEPPIRPASGVVRAEVEARVTALKKAREEALAADNERRVALCDEKLARLQDSGLRTLDDLFKDAREGRYSPLPNDAPAALAAVAAKAMAVEPTNRYVNARQIATELTAWTSGARVRAVTEAGGAVAAADTAKRAARRLVLPTLLALAAGALGFLLGGGAGKVTMLSSGADTNVLRDMIGVFQEQLDALSLEAADAAGPEAVRLHRALERQAKGIADRIAREPKGPERKTLEEQLAYQRRRIQPQRVRLAAPGAATWTAEVSFAGKVESYKLTTGDENLLQPGDYSVIGVVARPEGPQERFRVPLRLPLRIRPAGVSADREAPAVVIEVPADPAAIPEGEVLVLGGAVLVRQAPFAETSLALTDVRTFVLEREEVTNAEYAAFLATLPDAEAKARTPTTGFVLDPDTGRMAVVRGGTDVPVVSVRPEDARAYAAWKAKTTGKAWRLPTEAEWLLAAGAHLGWSLPGGRRGTYTDGVFQPALDVAGKHDHDVGPHGERGLVANAREMVEPSESGLPPGAVLVKGAGIGDTPADALVYLMRPLAPTERHAMTGFRLARPL